MIKMTSEGVIGSQMVEDLNEAIQVAGNWGYDNFILDGVKYVLFDGKYRRVENGN